MLDSKIIAAEIKNITHTQWKTDPVFFIVGMGLFFGGISSAIVITGYIIYQIIWKGMDFPSLTQITVLLSGVMAGVLGAFFLCLIYEEIKDKKFPGE